MSRYNSSKFEALVDVALRRLAEDFPVMTRDLKSEVARQNFTKRRRTPKARKTSSTWTTDLGSVLRLLGQARASALDMSIRKLKDLIRDKGGKLIIEKKLYKTDVDEGQYRLSMPLKQILSDDFLNQDEKMILNRSTKKRGLKNGLVVRFIGPCREETTMVLKKRNFTRSSSYVLIENWHKIAMKNGLKKGDTVQVWFFRFNKCPCFALLKP
ncbi:hypothetical protein TIFTF001_034761 [Ficus carica]|uniref:TF-B3 domain-containing protein n=1 Tax=Ficus carica TaxID=3494 RepID=A0AA88E3H5_FICCA|nr:hypothetical protein TIFTF001_049189 [Ficus carica]GMN65695.1 hypothetical protein TIFTF001_034761 [Ficus carica]